MRRVLAELTVQLIKKPVNICGDRKHQLEGEARGEPKLGRSVQGRMLKELSVATAIVSVCLLLHLAAMMHMAQWLLNRRDRLERAVGMGRHLFVLIVFFSVIVLLHVAETSIWALFYYSRTLFNDFETSLYFSMGSYTTIGYGDVVLPQNWRLLGAIEGISGVLLCGVSTAFLFTLVNLMFQIRIQGESTPVKSRLEKRET